MPLGLGSISDPVDRLTGQSSQGRQGDYDEIDEDRWANTYGDDLQAGVWRDLAEFIADPQNEYNIGFGVSDVPARVGRWYMVLDDGAGNEVVGQARVKSRNSNDEAVETEIRGVPSRRLNSDPSDYRKQYAVPEVTNTDSIGEDSKFVLQFKLAGSSAGTSVDFTADATVVSLPITNFS